MNNETWACFDDGTSGEEEVLSTEYLGIEIGTKPVAWDMLVLVLATEISGFWLGLSI